MKILLYTSFNVGGILGRMVRILNRHGIEAFFVDWAASSNLHDSSAYHREAVGPPFDLSHLGSPTSNIRHKIETLTAIRKQHGIGLAFATGADSWILKKAGFKYIYWSYGSDVDNYFSIMPYKNLNSYKTAKFVLDKLRNAHWLETAFHIRKTLAYAMAISCAPYQHSTIFNNYPKAKYFCFPHPIFLPTNEQIAIFKTELPEALKNARYILSTTRHAWRLPNSMMSDNKGNDILISGYAGYINKTHEDQTKLVLFKKGPDWEASAQYADKLGVGSSILWLDMVPRHGLSSLYAGAVAVLGQFGTPVLANTAVEPLGFGVPVISHYLNPYAVQPPVVNESPVAANVSHSLLELLKSEEKRASLGFESLVWARMHCSEQAFTDSFVRFMQGGTCTAPAHLSHGKNRR